MSIWGAALSTLLAVLKIIEFFRDRARLKVSVRGGYIVTPPSPSHPDKSYISIRVVNKGRRPVTISAAALRAPKGASHNAFVALDSLMSPHPNLTEGQSHSWVIKEDDLGFGQDRYVAFVEDAAGRRYYSHVALVRAWRLRAL